MSTPRHWPAWASLLVVVLLAWGGQKALSHWGHQRLGEPLRQLAQEGDIRLISSTTCRYCTLARQWLDNQQVRFSECFVETDPQCLKDYERTGARGTPTVLVRGQTQLGFDPERVLQTLQR